MHLFSIPFYTELTLCKVNRKVLGKMEAACLNHVYFKFDKPENIQKKWFD